MPASDENTGSGRFDPSRTVLLVIDPVNDFLHEDGAAWAMPKSTVKKNDVVAQLARLTAGARPGCRSSSARWPTPRRTTRGTDVLETDLPAHLERLGTAHLVLAGMTANLCVESTGQHATELGYDVTFLSDAIGAESLPAYEASIHVNYPLIGNAVMEVDDFLAGILPAAGGDVAVGDTVYGSDQGKLGTVEEIVPAANGAPGYLVVPRGVVFDKDTFIPLDAVVHRMADRAYVNVPKLVLGKLPWGEPPAAESTRAKFGPTAGEVDALYRSHRPTGSAPDA